MTPRPRSQPADPRLDRADRESISVVDQGAASSHLYTDDTIWIFGYGSLCWKPDFQYISKVVGRIKGYSRRFWQGNTAHRGTPNKPGRVATLIEAKDSEVWGVGYEVARNSPVLDYLWERECLLGGYHLIKVTFYPANGKSVDGLAYLATPTSPGWLGHAPVSDIALQVSEAKGPAGPNSEYICKLAIWIRNNTPVNDPHLDLLDILVRTAESKDVEISAKEKIISVMKNIEISKGKVLKTFDHSISRTQA